MAKNGRKKLLPAMLMAGAMAVPSAAEASRLAQDLSVGPANANPAPVVLDSQSAWDGDSAERIFQAQWAQITWGQVVWARAGAPVNKDQQ